MNAFVDPGDAPAYVVETFWRQNPNVPGLNNFEWSGTAPVDPDGFSDNKDVSTAAGRAIRLAHDISSTSDTTVPPIVANWNRLDDTINTPDVLSIQYQTGAVRVSSPVYVRWNGPSEGYTALLIGKCGCTPVLEMECGKGLGAGVTPATYLSIGDHRTELWNIDTGGTNSSRRAEYSLDGINFTSSTDALEWFTQPLTYECIKVLVELGKTRRYTNLATGEALDPATLLPCDPACTPGCDCLDSEALADAIVRKQRSVTPGAFTWINETNTVSLPVAPGARGRLVSVEDFGTGLVRWSLDGSDPIGGDAAEFTTTGPYHAAYAIENVDLSLVRLNGSSAGSDFSVVWEAYN